MRSYGPVLLVCLGLWLLPAGAGPVDDDPGKVITDRLLEVQGAIEADLRSREIARFRKGARRLDDEIARVSAILDEAARAMYRARRDDRSGPRAKAAERCYAIAAATRNLCRWARVEFQYLEPPGGDPDELVLVMRAAQILEGRAVTDLRAARTVLKAAEASFR